MPKVSSKYLDIHPYKIIETGFHKEKSKVSESIFSLGNEYHGIRGMFDEDYTGNTLKGSYFNGIYEYALSDTPNAYKGIVKRTHFMINSINWVKTRIIINNTLIDLNRIDCFDFYRELDMQNGLYTRSYKVNIYNTIVKITFERLLNMVNVHECLQRVTFESDKSVNMHVEFALDSNVLHWNSDCYYKRVEEKNDKKHAFVLVKTLSTKQKVFSTMHIDSTHNVTKKKIKDKEIINCYDFELNGKTSFARYVINLVDKKSKYTYDGIKIQGEKELKDFVNKSFDDILKINETFFKNEFAKVDIEINGDDLNQQGIRYCLFQLMQTYHGASKDNNIGAKGLTGEAYSGHAFWDSETYCFPFYLFSSQKAAKALLNFRYNTLKEAKNRAKDLDCEGACFPIATRNGKEGCNLWQHASLQFQPSTAVAYALFHYMNFYNDTKYMQDKGLELLIEISKFLLSRGSYNQTGDKFSFYNVMGPDEFQMMVNHNAYTNFMAKKTFDYLISLYNSNVYDFDKVFKKCNIDETFINKIKDASKKMYIIYDENTKLFEQHDGFFDLPHIDVNKIDNADFPLYSHWSYDRIYRNDMIKQPDVLMFMFLYSQDFSLEQKKANYEYYEPRCIHESSLSPSIHSIFACELNKLEEAKKFFSFATRLDLDDYNQNTCEGIHTTSIAAAYMNILYGFGGVRTDKDILKVAPKILNDWKNYSFRLEYKGANLKIKVDQEKVMIECNKNDIDLYLYDELIHIKKDTSIERKLV